MWDSSPRHACRSQSRGSAHPRRLRGILARIPAPRRDFGLRGVTSLDRACSKRAATLAALLVRAGRSPPGTAGAAERWSMRGAGWGHGIGMSQWGAYGYAKQGTGYRDILDHYYRDTQIEQRDGGVVRVLLQPNRSTVYLPQRDPGRRPAARRGIALQGHAAATSVVLRSATGGELSDFDGMIRVVGGAPRAAPRPRRQRRARRPLPRHARDPHRRRLRAERDQRARHGELPVRRRPEREPVRRGPPRRSRRRLSPRARTRSRSNVGGKGFNQYADTRSQVYRGFLGETPSTDTRRRSHRRPGRHLQRRGRDHFFFSTSGGHTENIENAFVGAQPRPWLKGVKDPYDDSSPYHRWGPSTSRAAPWARSSAAGSRAASAASRCSQRGVSPRVVRAGRRLARQHDRHRPADPRAPRPA